MKHMYECVGVDVGWNCERGQGERQRRGWLLTPPATPCRSGEGVSIQMKSVITGFYHPLVLDSSC